MNFKKIILIICLVTIILSGIVIATTGQRTNTNDLDKIKVTVSNFASYDFLRAIIGDVDNIELNFLLGAGKDAHSYDPTAYDLISIKQADLFVYIGGKLEKWSKDVLDTLDTSNTKIICIPETINIEEKEYESEETYIEENHEEHQNDSHEEHNHDHSDNETGFDGHVWTSPQNAIEMIQILEKTMEEIDEKNALKYRENAENYIKQIAEVDKQIQEIVDNKKRDTLIFGDKMPMQYFINYYNLKVKSAFTGCSTETEPSSKTIVNLVNKIKEEEIPVILYIELSTGNVAQIIANDVGENCEIMQIQTLHNVSKEDFDNGETWVSLMRRNLDVLKKALQ